ncbi:hypothetical protein GCM10010149_21060 [Nonomuraea roseoviolacea subsp. roseoviolacea]
MVTQANWFRPPRSATMRGSAVATICESSRDRKTTAIRRATTLVAPAGTASARMEEREVTKILAIREAGPGRGPANERTKNIGPERAMEMDWSGMNLTRNRPTRPSQP